MAKDMRSVRFNEKIKRLSTIFGAGGIALLVAALIRLSDSSLTLAVAGWIFGSVMLMFVSVQMNELLDPEDVA